MLSAASSSPALANAAVVVVGVLLGIGGQLTAGKLVAFLFLVTLFVAPVQIATEVLNEAQNALAGWRRVLDVLEDGARRARPRGADGVARSCRPGRSTSGSTHVTFRYRPAARPVLRRRRPGHRAAAPGGGGRRDRLGKTTFAKLLTRLMDPTERPRAARPPGRRCRCPRWRSPRCARGW